MKTVGEINANALIIFLPYAEWHRGKIVHCRSRQKDNKVQTDDTNKGAVHKSLLLLLLRKRRIIEVMFAFLH